MKTYSKSEIVEGVVGGVMAVLCVMALAFTLSACSVI
jgi:hypothetical protein